MRIQIFIITCFFLGSLNANAQNFFSEKFENCNVNGFAIESDTVTAKVSNVRLIKILTKGLDEKTINRLKGDFRLQIAVDSMGNSCLVSLQNNSNLKTEKSELKKAIDNDLVWERPKKEVFAYVVFRFKRGGLVEITRMGMNGSRGIHELVD
ncbi:hypothetical protein POV27_19525 [Aureisphaera galaxeae]|uniref:hypothetical protein n=1 Tax=Aureisphaera galaxeae TaxID=1538023 RepID=UPI002350AABA|nr:hypothetical protein [Aureisphaera galaxeae]MDC8006253.1 hypothetical protein [Aureisphaera galaxeae]